MPKEIKKHLKVTHTCKACEKQINNNVIVGTKKDFAVSDLTFAYYKSPANLNKCPSCGGKSFEVSYSFYHEEKIKK
ncbi:hypothetical protein Leef1_25 [Polaribacter phage Leef_1]|uniref:Uncharacterized protein n=1 Tax=Polaribacter phage Leef_1 TaxID=2745684 RepID=A0A8E5EBI7_9CAUD|nr:hypothetical protein M1M28_gp25 [Polaribacter phage Leef_1]QQV91389.1 hypothetical protein Leef1_25 [Polaribacter phage Leef_1]